MYETVDKPYFSSKAFEILNATTPIQQFYSTSFACACSFSDSGIIPLDCFKCPYYTISQPFY